MTAEHIKSKNSRSRYRVSSVDQVQAVHDRKDLWKCRHRRTQTKTKFTVLGWRNVNSQNHEIKQRSGRQSEL